MSDPVTSATSGEKGWRRFLHGRFLIISIVFHLLLAVGATYLVVQSLAPRKQTFKAGASPGNPAQKAVEHQVQLANKQKSMSAPAPAKKITTTGLAKVVLPEMPDMPTTSVPTRTMQSMGAPGLGTGVGTGMGGTGSGKGAGAAVPLFGIRTGNGLAGTFYDLKQSKSGKSNDLAIVDQDWKSEKEKPLTETYRTVVERVINSGLSRASLGRYFAGPTTLYSTQIFIPQLSAEEGPKAFNLPDVQPRRWIVIYSGKVMPSEGGKYQFAGVGDDWMVVRFNGRIVLNHGFFDREDPKEVFNPEGLAEGDFRLTKMAVGNDFTVRAGATYPMEVLIGEGPGGHFNAFLLLKKDGETYQKDARGNPKLPIFKLAPSGPVKAKGGAPVTAEDTKWSVWKSIRE